MTVTAKWQGFSVVNDRGVVVLLFRSKGQPSQRVSMTGFDPEIRFSATETHSETSGELDAFYVRDERCAGAEATHGGAASCLKHRATYRRFSSCSSSHQPAPHSSAATANRAFSCFGASISSIVATA